MRGPMEHRNLDYFEHPHLPSDATRHATLAGTARGYMSSALRCTTIEPVYTMRIPLDDQVTYEISGCGMVGASEYNSGSGEARRQCG